jgi:cytochrome b subunit of formate dehydrogenase
LIVVLIGSMVVHNGLVWRKKAVALRRAQDRSIIRMNTNQRTQHLLLLTSFIVLVLTGFALKYPDSWLAWLLGSSETIRRVGHRIAGVVLLTLGIYHVSYMLLTKEGRQGLKDFRPIKKDIYDLLDNLRYYLGLRSNKPKFGRFGYAEKAEYWAVVWGVIIMGITGLMAWFKVEVTSVMPRWSIDVALAIHFYEAILATLAIIVWHFYQVIFDPDAYPMNWAWWDGRVSVEHYEKEHPLAYEQLMEAQQKEKEQRSQEQLGREAHEPPEGEGIEPSPASSGDD